MVAIFGGFAKRTDQKIVIQPGTVESLGLADVRIDSATAAPSYDGATTWNIKLMGEVSNTSGMQLISSSFDVALQVAYTNSSGALTSIGHPAMTLLTRNGDRTPRTALPPIAGMMPVQYSFFASDGVDPNEGIIVGMIPVTYVQNSILGLNPSKTWSSVGASQFWVINFTV